jgi:hypothetical protein
MGCCVNETLTKDKSQKKKKAQDKKTRTKICLLDILVREVHVHSNDADIGSSSHGPKQCEVRSRRAKKNEPKK